MKQVSQHRKDELARRKRMGIALVQRPLRFIAAKTNTVGKDEKGNTTVTESGEFIYAKRQASRGHGNNVQFMAMNVAQR
jgi:hypothetical protein